MTVWQRFRMFVSALYGSAPHPPLRIERRPAVQVPRVAVDGLEPEATADNRLRLSSSDKAPSHADPAQGRRMRIHRSFDVASPVRDRFGLSGRRAELGKLSEAVLEQHKHAVVYGPRGSGKTSLVRVFGDLADEGGHLVLYESTSSELSFSELFRPFLANLPGTEVGESLHAAAQRLAAAPDFAVRDLTSLLADVREPVVLIIDEFDQISADAVKVDVASLMKLISDIRSQVRVVIVGIGKNLDQLISGHPSLRRHMISIPLGPIADTDLSSLIKNCAERAGFAFEPTALGAVVGASLGSAYHARLFGMNAVLAANMRDVTEITAEDTKRGFSTALTDWADISGDSYRLFETLSGRETERDTLLRLALKGARLTPTVDLVGETANDVEDESSVKVLRELMPALQPTSSNGDIVFRDSLAPQFLAVMAMYGVRAA